MSTNLDTRIIDGDGHIIEDNKGIIAHMESPYREIAGAQGHLSSRRLDHLHSGRAVETPPQRDGRAPVGPEGWLDFLDDVGIDWTVLYPTVALVLRQDRQPAITPSRSSRAYNDWLTRDLREVQSALQGHGESFPMQDPEEAAKELRRAVTELGMLGAMMPSNGLRSAARREAVLAGLRRSQPPGLLSRRSRRRS